MPRDSGGTYTLPAGNPVVDGTVIESVWANSTLNDIALQLNNVLTRDGVLGPNQPVKFIDGSVALPGIAFAAQPGSGIYRAAPSTVGLSVAGVSRQTWAPALTSIVGDVSVGGNLAIAGTTAFTGAVTLTGAITAAGGSFSSNVIYTAAEAIRLEHAAGAIVWRVPSSQNPPGIVIQRTGTDLLYLSGLGGIVLNSPAGNLEFVSNYFRPSNNEAMDLGGNANRFRNFYAFSIISTSTVNFGGNITGGGALTINGAANVGILNTAGGPVFGAAQQIVGNATITLSDIGLQQGIGGKIVLVRGADIGGAAFAAAYIVAATIAGGFGFGAVLLGRAGSANPTLAFSTSGNNVTLTTTANGNVTFVSVVG